VGFRVLQKGEEENFTRYRSLRGGSWLGDPAHARAAYRFRLNPDYRGGSVGFRVVQEVNNG
jgi:formylglycine-generating enzyme required for sulfatase activity